MMHNVEPSAPGMCKNELAGHLLPLLKESADTLLGTFFLDGYSALRRGKEIGKKSIFGN